MLIECGLVIYGWFASIIRSIWPVILLGGRGYYAWNPIPLCICGPIMAIGPTEHGWDRIPLCVCGPSMEKD